jgi:chromate transporter
MKEILTGSKVQKPSFANLIKVSLYIGATAYGGPAMIAQMKKKFVEEKRWMDEKDFLGAFSFAQLLPGATFVTLMAYIGYRLKKIAGVFIVPFFFILPTFIAVVILSYIYFHYGSHSYIISVFTGLGAMVVALLINAVVTLSKSIFPQLSLKYYKGFLVASFVFAFSFWFKVNTIYLIVAAGGLGFLFYYFTGEFEGISKRAQTAPVINESTAPSSSKLLAYSVPIIIVLIMIPIFIFFPIIGNIYTSFFKIGIFSFGGYSSLPLMQHETINILHWLTLKEFSDGIAMGQITPGPILITATFIGYKVAGILGAATATAGIFSPSILLIILLYEIHSKLTKLSSVKVIVKGILAGFIGLLFSITIGLGITSLFNWQTWAIFILSSIALIKFRIDPIWIILSSMVVSLIIL